MDTPRGQNFSEEEDKFVIIHIKTNKIRRGYIQIIKFVSTYSD